MSEIEIPIVAEFFQAANGSYELRRLRTLKDPTPGTLGALFGSIHMYDVDWCDRDSSYLWHMSGGGGRLPIEVSGPYWSRIKADVKQEPSDLCERASRKRNRTRRLISVPIDMHGCAHVLDYLNCYGIQEESVWCGACKDHLPGDDLCEHCWWCYSAGWYVTPDEGKLCFDPDCRSCRNFRRRRHEAYRDKKRQERWEIAGEGERIK